MDERPSPRQPEFSRRPERRAERMGAKLIRVKPGPGVSGILISHDSIGCYTHYMGGKTVPCLAEKCPCQESGATARWTTWQTMMSPGNGQLFILELPAIASNELYDWFDTHRTLKGWPVTIKRMNDRMNSQLFFKWGNARVDAEKLPSDLPIVKIIRRMWKIGEEVLLNTPDIRIASGLEQAG